MKKKEKIKRNERIVENNNFRILASNVDTLVLAIDIWWKNGKFLDYLGSEKRSAIEEGKDVRIELKNSEDLEPYLFNLKEHGTKGYEWILICNEYSLMIGNWETPKTRPSIMATIRSETLWRMGSLKSVNFLLNLLSENGARINKVKLSRMDLCVDILIPEKYWSKDLIGYAVTRANDRVQYFDGSKLQGIRFGKGNISARLYDKELEIKQQSKKHWMYSVWKFDKVPNNMKVIRVEFQIRREVMRELGLDEFDQLITEYGGVWSYCTKKWLNFKDNPGKHQKHQRKTFDWWKKIQNGFLGMENENPSIRCKSLKIDKEQLVSQVFGFLSSIEALNQETRGTESSSSNLDKTIDDLKSEFFSMGKDEIGFKKDVANKRAKYQRSKSKVEKDGDAMKCIVWPNYTDCGGTIIDWMDLKEGRIL